MVKETLNHILKQIRRTRNLINPPQPPGDDDRRQESLLDVGVEARAALGLLEHLADLVEHGVRPQHLVADVAAHQHLLLVLGTQD